MSRFLPALPLLLAAAQAFARAGGGEGYSGGSSGSAFGSSFSSSSRGEGDFLFDLALLYFRFVILYPVFGIPLTFFLLYLAYLYHDDRSRRRTEAAIGAGLQRQTELRLRGEREELRGRDPGFDEKTFLARVSAAFVKVQAAWSLGDMALARPFVSDGVYERFTRQLRDLRDRGLTNVMQEVKVLDAEVLGYESDRHFDALHVWVRASALDKTVAADGTVVRSSDGHFAEVWSFLRRPGAKTLKAGGGIEGRCPSCGAVLSVADAGKCASCGTWVNSGEHDWVLAEITQRSEWAGGDSRRDVDGWVALSEADPALNLQVLEDRASVVFWRWLEALRRREPSALLPVATPAAAAAALAEAAGASWLDAAVGAVEVTACERAGAVDRVHAQVRWEATPAAGGARAPQRQFFVHERSASAKTDARLGLHTLRCPSCGAPPAAKDEAACAYCSKPFNDGTRDWVLVEVVPFGRWRRPSAAAPAAAAPPMPGFDWDGGLAPAEAAAVLARAMVSDGEVSAHEQRYLVEYGRSRGIDGERVSQIVASARAGLLDAPKPADGAQAEAMLRGLIRMSLADGRVSDGETAALTAFARRFGLHAADVKSFVDEERAALLKSLR
ncbi:MAG: TIM44-like domain-containing protein [Elusimicrobiota bacterium]|nr:TIM44-like domain-containing protein [Elusimicrobiota bacterium]